MTYYYPTLIMIHGLAFNILVQSHAGRLEFGVSGRPLLRRASRGEGRPVPVLHGLIAGVSSRCPKHRFLEDHGHAACPGLASQSECSENTGVSAVRRGVNPVVFPAIRNRLARVERKCWSLLDRDPSRRRRAGPIAT